MFNQAAKAFHKWNYEVQRKLGRLKTGIDGFSGLSSDDIIAARELKTPKGVYTFVAHGNKDGIMLGGLAQAFPNEFGELIDTLTAQGYTGDKPLLMFSCNIADNGLGKALSNYYGQTVIDASTGQVSIYGSPSEGYMYKPSNPSAYMTEF